MSTFTITISASGNVKGQAVSFLSEFDVEDVHDIATLNDNGQSMSIGSNASGAPAMPQDCPSVVFIRNNASTQPASARMALATDVAIFGLAAGQFVLLHEAAQGEGILTINATPTDVLDEVTECYVNAFPGFHGTVPNNTVINLYTAAS
jgi:hypothetical protein